MAKAAKVKVDTAAIVKPPDGMEDEALLKWYEVTADLQEAKKLAKTDRSMLILFCETWQIYRKAMAHVDKFGAAILFSNGTAGPNPFYKISRETTAQLSKMANDLGLSPINRDKVKNAKNTSGKSVFDGL